MNTTAEVTMTSLIFGVVVFLGVMVLMASIVFNITHDYGVENIEEFTQYEELYTDFDSTAKELIKSQDLLDDDNEPKNWLDEKKTALETWWENNLIRRGWQTIKQGPKLLIYGSKSLNTAIDNTIYIPASIKWMAGIILGLIIVFTFVKAYWEKRI